MAKPKIKSKPPSKSKKGKSKTGEPHVTQLSGGKIPKSSKNKGSLKPDADQLSLSKEIKNLRKLVRGKDNDLTSITATRAFLGVALESVLIAEKEYREKPHAHNSYALNGLINQARELAADLKALENVSDNKSEIITSTVHTVMRRLGFQMIQQINLIKAASDVLSGKDRKRFQRMCDKAGVTITEYTSSTAQALIEELTKN